MEYGNVPGVTKPVARLVQGTVMLTAKEEDRDFSLLDALFDQGWNTFDAAHGYGGGECERVLGKWLKKRGNREEVVVIDKGAHPNRDRGQRVTPFDIGADLHDSLARLQTDYIDIYLLHRDDPSVPVGPIVEVLHEYQQAGKIRAYGGSNWTHERLREANDYARAHDLDPFVASSPNYSLTAPVEAPWPGCITISGPRNAAARQWYEENRMLVFSWSSLSGGFLSGRITRANFETVKEEFPELVARCYATEENFQRLERAETLAQEKGVAVPQIALAFVLNQPFTIFALVACYKPEEGESNQQALEVELTPAECAWLDLRSDSR